MLKLLLLSLIFLQACSSVGSDDSSNTSEGASLHFSDVGTGICYSTYKTAMSTAESLFHDGRKDVESEELDREIANVFGDRVIDYSLYLRNSLSDFADSVGFDVRENVCATYGKVIVCNQQDERISALQKGGDLEDLGKGIAVVIHELFHSLEFNRDDNILRWCELDYGETGSERYAYKVSEMGVLSPEQKAALLEDSVRCRRGLSFKKDYNEEKADCETLQKLALELVDEL